MDKTVRDFKGKNVRIQCSEDEIMDVVYDLLIAPFLDDFEYAWLSGTRAENRVKNYLTYVGGLMIRNPDEHDVISSRRLRKIHGLEVSEDSKNVNPVVVKPKGKKTEETKSNRIDKVRERHPNASITFCRVDTENCFEYGDLRFRIPMSVKAYAPKKTPSGLYYEFDQCIVVNDNGKLYFYDQDFIPLSQVSVVGDE